MSRSVPLGWTCEPQAAGSTDSLSCKKTTLSEGDGAQSFTLVLRVDLQSPSGTEISNTATVSTTSTETNAGNNTAMSTTEVTFSPSLPAVVATSTNWTLHDMLATNGTDTTFSLGARPLVPLTGDWDANGSRTPGYFKGGTFFLSNSTGPTPGVDDTITFGDPRGFPVAGDFDGDGTDDIAVFRKGLWQVRLSTGEVLADFTYGSGSWRFTVPLAGDWDGDGTDGIGFYTLTTGIWNLRNTASTMVDDIGPFLCWDGSTSSYPVVGDWDGDGIDTIGVRAGGSSWQLNNANNTGSADITFTFGASNGLPLTWRPLP